MGGFAGNLPSLMPLARFRGGGSAGASVLETAANIFTDIVPAGMLPISMAVTIAMLNAPPVVSHPLVVALVSAFAFVAHHTLVLIGEAVEASGVVTPSLTAVWASSEVLGGSRTTWLIDASAVLLCSGCCVFYLCVRLIAASSRSRPVLDPSLTLILSPNMDPDPDLTPPSSSSETF